MPGRVESIDVSDGGVPEGPVPEAAVDRGLLLRGMVSRLSQRVHPGRSRVYARVLEAGIVRVGDPVRLSRPAEVPARADRPY